MAFQSVLINQALKPYFCSISYLSVYLSVWLINCHYFSVSGLMPLNQTALSVIALTKPMFLCVSVNLSLSLSLSLSPPNN